MIVGELHMSYDRDGDIFELFNNGMTEYELSKRFKIRKGRIRQIIQDQRIRKRKGNPDIYQIDAVCRILGIRENERGKIQSILHANGYTSYDDKWKKLKSNDILRIPLLGKFAMCIIWLAQNMAGFDLEDWK